MNAFGRNVEITVANKIIRYPALELSFELNFDTSSDGNVGNIKIYNLSEESVRLLKKNEVLTLKAGYKDDLGEIFYGVISSASTKWNGSDKETELIIGDHTDTWLNSIVNTTWKAGISASKIVSDIVDTIPLEVGEIAIDEDKEYPKGKTFSCTSKKALEELSQDLNLKLHVNKGKIYLRGKEKGTEQVIILNQDSGLIASPQKINAINNQKEGYKIQSLLNYKIETDAVLKVESKTINSKYRVEKGKHFLNGGDFLTEVEVFEYEG